MKKQVTLGVIGGGFMARALVGGAIKQGFLAAEEIAVGEPSPENAEKMRALGVRVTQDDRDVASSCRCLLLCVKPQSFSAVAEDLRGIGIPFVISIMAGVTRERIASALGCRAVARAMPNLPCAVGEGMTAVAADGLTEERRAFALGLFSAAGRAMEAEERLLDAVTGVSGSGPAYVYLFLRSLIEAGIAQGLSREQAETLAFQTVKGGLKMAESTSSTLSELIAAVSSKGGTTVAALSSLEKDDFAGAVTRAVAAAAVRAAELSS